ncbi:Unknown protein, partial [Striga hermonthica]
EILINGDSAVSMQNLITKLGNQFALKTMGEVNHFWGFEALRTSDGFLLNQSKYALDLKVGKLDSPKELWEKLQELYTETSLPNKLFLLEKFFRFKLDLSKDMDDNLDVFTKLVQDIKQTGDKHIDYYTPIVLLNVIPDSYSDVKSAIKYGRDNVNLETVVNSLKSKELDLKTNR